MNNTIDRMEYEVLKKDVMQALALIHKALITQEKKIQDMDDAMKALESRLTIVEPDSGVRADDTGKEL